MNWNTIYIKGNADFRSEVRKKLDQSNIKVMPGSMEFTTDNHDLYWLDDTIDMRTFRQAIGSKLIWKYRLRFYTKLEDILQLQNIEREALEFTTEDHEIIKAISQLSFGRNDNQKRVMPIKGKVAA